MSLDPSLLPLAQAVLTVGFGALAGGLTNWVAIWMLFHPYEPAGIGIFKLQGAIPKNRDRLARSIGKTVGERLLTPQDLEQQLTAPEFRAAFERTLGEWLAAVLQRETGAIRDLLPRPVAEELESLIVQLAPRVADRFAEFAATDAFRDAVRRLIEREAALLGDRPVADVLTEARQQAIKASAERWVTTAADSPELERAIRGFVDRQVDRLAGESDPLLERLPRGLVAAVEQAITEYLPVALERLAGLLAREDVRSRVQATVHDLFRRFTRDLLLHERVIARLMVNEKTIERMIVSFEHDGADQVGRLLEEPALRGELARSVNDAVVTFLRRPLRDHLGSLKGERLEGVKRTAADYVLQALRDPATRRFAIQRLDAALEAAERRTWGDLLRLLPPDRAAEWLAGAARGERVRAWMAEGFAALARALLDRPIGRPASLMPADAPARLTASLAGPLWAWLTRQVPIVVAQLSVREMVEEKVRGFPVQRVEEIIRGVTQRELNLIVRLGFWLGGAVGAVAYALTRALG